MIELSHYSKTPFTFNPQMKYQQEDNFKPVGLWLSDDTDHGWHKWCTSEQWGLAGLTHQTKFRCNISDWLCLTQPEHITTLINIFPAQHGQINWPELQETYSGIIITPYQWECRLNQNCRWYYSWDCASACVWNLSTVEVLL